MIWAKHNRKKEKWKSHPGSHRWSLEGRSTVPSLPGSAGAWAMLTTAARSRGDLAGGAGFCTVALRGWARSRLGLKWPSLVLLAALNPQGKGRQLPPGGCQLQVDTHHLQVVTKTATATTADGQRMRRLKCKACRLRWARPEPAAQAPPKSRSPPHPSGPSRTSSLQLR